MPKGGVRACRRVMLFASKGGMGKTTIASNLLVSAAQDGFKSIGVDFDGQKSLMSWFDARGQHPSAAEMVAVDVGPAPLDEWEMVLDQTGRNYDLAIFDMPPGIDPNLQALLASLAPRMDLIIIPTPPERPSYGKVVDFMGQFRKSGLKSIWVLNKVVKNRNSLREARAELTEHGPVCPVEITMRDEVWRAFDVGSAVSELGDAASHAEMQGVWKFARGCLSC